jgi:hypothetical protein
MGAAVSKLYRTIVVMGAAFGAACGSTDESSSSADAHTNDGSSDGTTQSDTALGDVGDASDATSLDAGDVDDGEVDAGTCVQPDVSPCSSPDADGVACCCLGRPATCTHGYCWPCYV